MVEGYSAKLYKDKNGKRSFNTSFKPFRVLKEIPSVKEKQKLDSFGKFLTQRAEKEEYKQTYESYLQLLASQSEKKLVHNVRSCLARGLYKTINRCTTRRCWFSC